MNNTYNKGEKVRRGMLFLMLAKRLMFKKSFIALLLLIPLLAGLMSVAAKEDSGIMTVILVGEGEADNLSHVAVDSIANEDSVVNYKVYDDADAAKEEVRFGKADAVWVFPEDFEERLTEYSESVLNDTILVYCYQTSENTMSRLIRERLNSAVYSFLSAKVFDRFSEKEVFSRYGFGDSETLKRYREESAMKTEIVELEYLGAAPVDTNDTGFLASPIRGLCALASILCTLAASLFTLKDERDGFFSRIPIERRLSVCFASNITAALISSAVMVISLLIAGMVSSVAREIASALVFALASAAFCTLLCRIFTSPFALGAAIPPLTAVMAVVCPIFLSVKLPVRADLLFPATYAVRGIRIDLYLLYGLLYAAVCLAASFLLDRIRAGRRHVQE